MTARSTPVKLRGVGKYDVALIARRLRRRRRCRRAAAGARARSLARLQDLQVCVGQHVEVECLSLSLQCGAEHLHKNFETLRAARLLRNVLEICTKERENTHGCQA
eukprot:1983993-Pleurochrysis_carterae.AAC.4